MQAKEATELRLKWGSKDCDHPSTEKEYDRDISTGDWACTVCGEVGWGRHWVEENKQK